MSRTPAAMPASPQRRFLAATGATLLLAGLIIGLPLALALLAGNPLPDDLPTIEGLRTALTSPDDGTLFLAVLTVVGWIAWASFTVSVALEGYARFTLRPAPALPGLRSQQRLAAALITAVLAALATSPTLTSADAALIDAPPVVAELSPSIDPVARQAAVAEAAAETSAAGIHLVERGEGMLDLQERYGIPWQRIAEANYGVEQPDGRSLQRGQTRIYPGWQMRIPGPAASVEESIPAGSVEGFGVAPAATPAHPSGQSEQVYQVERGDWMWHVADRYLGEPERYPEIAALNPELRDRHGDFPDHIEAGWQLRLPEDAVDSGPVPHATGSAIEVDADQTDAPAPTADETPALAEPTIEFAQQPTPPPPTESADSAGHFGYAPVESWTDKLSEQTGVDQEAEADQETGVDQADLDQETGVDTLMPAGMAGAGLLAALVLGSIAHQLRRRHAYHRPGFRYTSAAARRLDQVLRCAQQPSDRDRLQVALRCLAAGLAHRQAPLPDIVGAMVDEGTVHLLLAEPCPDPPDPWRQQQDRWTLTGEVETPPDGPLAPLPTLATVGSQAGIHLLLDLERLGFLTVHGDIAQARSLLRYLAAELACNTWSDQVEVLVAGFDQQESRLLVGLDPDRVRPLPSICAGVTAMRRRIAAARASLHHVDAADTLDGRARGLAGDAWMPQVLLAADPTSQELATLQELGQELDQVGRCAVAVAATSRKPAKPGQKLITVTADGAVHLRLPWVRASLTAASLSLDELAQMSEAVQAARIGPVEPVPPAAEVEPWATGTDAAGALLPQSRTGPVAPVGSEHHQHQHPHPHPHPQSGTLPPYPQLPAAAPVAAEPSHDQQLDLDLIAWYADDPNRPRIGVLGPVLVKAAGTAPDSRHRLHAELVVFLAQRGARGADPALLSGALWPDTDIPAATMQRIISRARRWLGPDLNGAPWLSDVAAGLVYRLAEGYLFDWHLFRRLRTRAENKGDAGTEDLRAALRLVRGIPLDRADRTSAPGARNPYPWLAESNIRPDHIVATVIDTAHQLAELCLAAGDTEGVRWAVRQAWCADTERGYDQPWRDLMRAEQADGATGRLRALLAELMELREAELPADLAPDTYHLIRRLPAATNI